MDLKRLETLVQRTISKKTEGLLDALRAHGSDDELAYAASTLAGREALGPIVPDDPNKPWA